MPVCSPAIRSIRVRGKPHALARRPAESFRGPRNSSRRTSPGCIGLSFFAMIAFLINKRAMRLCAPGVDDLNAAVAEILDVPRCHGSAARARDGGNLRVECRD